MPPARVLPRAAASREERASPLQSTSPALGTRRPPSRCSSVVLPEPDGPCSATLSPGAMLRSTPTSARTCASPLPYTTDTPRHEERAVAPAVATLLGSPLRREVRRPGRRRRRRPWSG